MKKIQTLYYSQTGWDNSLDEGQPRAPVSLHYHYAHNMHSLKVILPENGLSPPKKSLNTFLEFP